jgi:hypothetical protein
VARRHDYHVQTDRKRFQLLKGVKYGIKLTKWRKLEKFLLNGVNVVTNGKQEAKIWNSLTNI